MSKSIIIGVIILMSISLLGVVGLQLYWITDAIKVKEEQFDRSVHEALHKVVAKLETQEAISVVTGQMVQLQLPADTALPAMPALSQSPAPARSQPKKPTPAKHPAPAARPAPVVTTTESAKGIKVTAAESANQPGLAANRHVELRTRHNDSTITYNGKQASSTRKVIIRNRKDTSQVPPTFKIMRPDVQAITLLQSQSLHRLANMDSLMQQARSSTSRITFSVDSLLHLVNRLDSLRFIRHVGIDAKAFAHLNPDGINSIVVNKDTIYIYEKPSSVTYVQQANAPAIAGSGRLSTRTRPLQETRTEKALLSSSPAPTTTVSDAPVAKAAPAKKEHGVKQENAEKMEKAVRVEVNKVEAKKEKLNDVVKQMVEEYVVKEKPLKERLNLHKLNTLLRTELEDKGIKLDFGYRVVSGLNDTIATRTTQTAGMLPVPEYRVSLFPHDIFEKPDYLAVYFPDSKTYALRSLWLMLILSSAFTLIIILTFGSTIYIIFRQKKLSEMKNDFINNMTHEFKTPIATISLATDSISNPKIFDNPDKIRYYNNIIREENKRMNAQVENVLQIALLEKNEFKMDLRPVDVHLLILRAVERIKLQVEQRAGLITAQLNALQHELQSDEVHLYNVICNLLDNANKYSPASPDIKLLTQNVDGGILIAVEDKGLGMSKDTQQLVFEKFYRVPTGNLHNVKGFGLGLSYVKAIVEAHRGSIRLKSEPGKGSRFEIFLPIAS